MFRLTQNLLMPLLRLVKLLSIMWLDCRVPLIARLLIFFAPLYWICPFDLNPDFLPGGYADDLWIVPIAIVIAAKLIPLAVFYDARKAAAQAVCGIMCLGLTIMPSDHSAEIKTSSTTIVTSSEAQKILYSQNAHASMAKCVVADGESAAACPGIGQTGAVPLAWMRASYRENEQRLPLQRMHKVSRVRTSSFLLARGGQIQLYGIDGIDGDAAPDAAILPEANLPRVTFCRLLAQAVFLSKNRSARERAQYKYKDKRSVAKAAC